MRAALLLVLLLGVVVGALAPQVAQAGPAKGVLINAKGAPVPRWSPPPASYCNKHRNEPQCKESPPKGTYVPLLPPSQAWNVPCTNNACVGLVNKCANLSQTTGVNLCGIGFQYNKQVYPQGFFICLCASCETSSVQTCEDYISTCESIVFKGAPGIATFSPLPNNKRIYTCNWTGA